MSEPAASVDSRASVDGRADARSPSQAAITVDDSSAVATYANFFRITSTPEELILDLGLNQQAFAQGDTTVRIAQRIAVNYFTAKRLLGALAAAVQRHEKSFGEIETDVMKRVHPRDH